MSLTGTPLLWVLGVLTIGLPVLTILLWSRMSAHRPSAIVGRVTLLVASQLVGVMLIGAAVNDYAYLYGSWGELWSSATQPFQTRYPVTPLVPGNGQGAFPAAGVSRIRSVGPYGQPSRWAHTGRLESMRLDGATSQLGESAFVYLPPQYFQAAYRHTRFPGVEVFSGYPSTNRMLVQRLAFQRSMLREINRHRVAPMVLVMLRPIVTFPRDTECTNVPSGPQAETFYAQDIPAAVAARYRVAPTGWGAVGVSTGGYCATKIAMSYPSLFTAAVSLSGYYHALQDYTTGDLWGGSRTLRNLNSPEWRLRHQPAPPVSLLLTSSKDEGGPLGYQDTLRFLRLVRRPLQVGTIISAHGTHTFTTWQPEIPRSLRWLSARLYAHLPGSTTSSLPNGHFSVRRAGADLRAGAPARATRAPSRSGGPRRPRASR
ncbi:MAG: alpha/beta hydrolase-fold protein [Marmoricola sp.]